ncbi:MAG TPA: hypothetical protein PKJ41_12625 [Bryobacteraceae bacterium]|nr:hypothetical protein [Bryobacteraceae bacterium]HPT27243.1 hypothetical protein [Bryobacteraceae bacterium]
MASRTNTSGRVARLVLLSAVAGLPAVHAGWDELLRSVNLDPAAVTILEGPSSDALALGIVPSSDTVRIRSVADTFDEKLQIVWQHDATVPVFALPAQARVFTRERWTGAPLAAGWRAHERIVFWTATPIGGQGYERYPYLLQALVSLGLRPAATSRDLWAFLDASYRLRADPDYLASLWRKGGIAGLHVAAWQFWEPDPQRDAWLKSLIEACHRQAILVYAWIEFPHVSERFWQDHSGWREKTATGQDAHLDWRKLMNLADPACDRAIHTGLDSLASRFDWDGLNLGELYFESLEGYLNPARFTPFHPSIRRQFQDAHGFDPAELYNQSSPRFHKRTAAPMREFLDFRAELARSLQKRWLARLAAYRAAKPGLDIVLTHIDDRFDPAMRDALGADAASLIPETERYNATFLIEDPATVWHLGPARYTEIARRYAALAKKPELLAIDLNIVERYQDVYPARQQTGGELLLLLRRAAEAFPRVALYSENSIPAPDWPLLAAAAAPGVEVRRLDAGLVEVDAAKPVWLPWAGCAAVDGLPWPVGGADDILLPAGSHRVSSCPGPARRSVADLNATLLGVEKTAHGWCLRYQSRSRAILVRAQNGKPAERVYLPAGNGQFDWVD